jgi:ribA/ribD-fused uncharacterized protein
MSRIDSFSGINRFLSNFYPAVVVLDDDEYPTVEHAYQAAKTIDPEERRVIQSSTTPAMAKKLGRHVTVRDDWLDIKLGIMAELLVQKFTNDPRLSDLLVGTAPAELIEGNWWGDVYWGQCRGYGENHLGRLLMAIRAELLERAA